MFDLSKFFSQCDLRRENYIFFLYKHLKKNAKKPSKKQLKIFPPVFVVQNQTYFFFYEVIKF